MDLLVALMIAQPTFAGWVAQMIISWMDGDGHRAPGLLSAIELPIGGRRINCGDGRSDEPDARDALVSKFARRDT